MIIFFSSPIGLGHATRDVAICQKICEISNETILFITGKSAYHLISNSGFKAHDLYHPPSFHLDDTMQMKYSFIWLVKYLLYYYKCKNISKNVIDRLVVKDNLLIVSDEDFASVAVAEEKNQKNIIITDVVESRFLKGKSSFIEDRMNKSLEKTLSKSSAIIIPDYNKQSVIQDKYDNLSYVEPIVREITIRNREELRSKLGIEKQTILISIGGTNSGKFLIDMATRACQNLKKKMDIDIIIATGPSIALTSNKFCKGIRNIGFKYNLHEYIYASDLIISLAGKSTIDESLAYGTPGIFIPIRGHFEQEENARMMGFSFYDIYKLESIIERVMSKSRKRFYNLPKGSENAARLILNSLHI